MQDCFARMFVVNMSYGRKIIFLIWEETFELPIDNAKEMLEPVSQLPLTFVSKQKKTSGSNQPKLTQPGFRFCFDLPLIIHSPGKMSSLVLRVCQQNNKTDTVKWR